MTASTSLIPELEEVVQNGTPAKRTEALKKITSLFLDGATHFSEAHVQVFDDVLSRLISEIESKTRSELARRLAPVENAPPGVVRELAKDDDINVAGPLLAQSSRLDEHDLVQIARSKGQAHLFAISARPVIAEAVTDVLVRRGDREVIRKVADNQGAKLSETGFTALVNRAEKDGVLAEKVGQRPDIPPHLFRDLLVRATEVVQKRLLASAKPETQAEIQRVLRHVSSEVGAKVAPRDYSKAQETVSALHRTGALKEADIVEFAKSGRFEETVVGLSMLCGVPLEVVDRLMTGDRPDPVLILCKASGFGWPTVRAIINVRTPKGASAQALDAAHTNFERLSAPTAQRVLRFWQVRQGGLEAVG